MKHFIYLLIIICFFSSCENYYKFGFSMENRTNDTIFFTWRRNVHEYTGNTLQYTSLENIGFWSWEHCIPVAPKETKGVFGDVQDIFFITPCIISIFVFEGNTRRNYTIKELKELNYCDSIITISYPELQTRGFRIVYDGKENVENEESEE